jgi:hypothetical protein
MELLKIVFFQQFNRYPKILKMCRSNKINFSYFVLREHKFFIREVYWQIVR